jgi:superfamily II DNA/RNA helicase
MTAGTTEPSVTTEPPTAVLADGAPVTKLRPFSDFNVSQGVIDALAAVGMHTAFPIQELVLDDATAGRDVLAKSKTGSGKTLAFAIPIVERLTHDDESPAALILVPTRELATQVAEHFAGIAGFHNLKVATAYGGISIGEQAKRARACDVLVATPGRLLDLENRRLVSLKRVRICVLDEADRMLDMGFLPDVNQILSLLPAERQTMMFSATLDGIVGGLARKFTNDPVRHEIIELSPLVSEADHRFIPVEEGEKIEVLAKELADEPGVTLVFTRTKRGADMLARKLKNRGFEAEALHGDMAQNARERALARFGTKTRVLVATDVAARGLDLDDIAHVVNYDPPDDDASYVHRVGRTARAGRSGIGSTLVLPRQRGDVSRMAARLKLKVEFEASGMKMHPPRVVYRGGRRGGGIMGTRKRR